MASATGSPSPLPPDPLRLKQWLLLQGGGFALLLLTAFSGSLYWGIVQQREEDQRAELRQIAAGAAAQLPLVLHEAKEVESPLKFRAAPSTVAIAGLEQQRLQWFDRAGRLQGEQGRLALPPLRRQGQAWRSQAQWQRWPGGLSLWQPVLSRDPSGRSAGASLSGYVRVARSDQASRRDLQRLQRGVLLGWLVTVLAALLVGRRMLRSAFAPLQHQLEALQRFTADASHELRHPLTAMRTLLAAVPETERHRPPLPWQELDRLSRAMGEQLDDLLLLARQEQGEAPRRFDLLELLEDLLDRYGPQAAQRGIRLQLRPDPASCRLPISAHPEQLQRLFTNLLLNAIRHSPEGGTVSVEVSPSPQRLQIAVVDAGPGIAAGERERVFERYWRGSDQGGHSGLGLAIARSIARRHGGELRLGESQPGRCVLLVELPTARSNLMTFS